MTAKTDKVAIFKRILPYGDCGLSDAEIAALFVKWFEDNLHLTGAEAAYQCAFYLMKLKASLNKKSQSAGV